MKAAIFLLLLLSAALPAAAQSPTDTTRFPLLRALQQEISTVLSGAVSAPEEPDAETPPTSVSGPAELPRVTVSTAMPVTRRVMQVPATGDLRAALAAARGGDVIELQAGATYAGDFQIPARADTGWVVVRSSRADSLPAGKRVTPSEARFMARILGTGTRRVLLADSGDARWRFIGIEVTHDTVGGPAVVSALIDLELGSSDIVLDRMLIRSTPEQSIQRCIVLNGANQAVIDSWVSECHGRGFDSQAILGYRGAGPYLILNNHLAGAGENIMFGGAALGPEGHVPSDITIRGNHIFKPMEWEGKWTTKNLLELKIAERVLIEGNVLENVWAGAQVGFAFNIKSENRDITRYPDIATRDVTVRWNQILNARFGATIIGGASTPEHTGAGRTSRVYIGNNTFVFSADESNPRAFQYSRMTPADLIIENNVARRGTVVEGPSQLRDLSKALQATLRGNTF